MDRDGAEAALREFREVRDGLRAVQRDAWDLTSMRPPADDPASVRFNDAAVAAFEKGAEFVDQEIQTYSDLVARLEKALGVYQEADESAAGQAGGADESDKGFI